MPTLATIIGLNESIILQQVHYWLKIKEKSKQDYIDGHYWVYNTYEQWQEQFPFFSIRTLRRTFTSLEKMGLLLTGNYNKVKFDQTNGTPLTMELTKISFLHMAKLATR